MFANKSQNLSLQLATCSKDNYKEEQLISGLKTNKTTLKVVTGIMGVKNHKFDETLQFFKVLVF